MPMALPSSARFFLLFLASLLLIIPFVASSDFNVLDYGAVGNGKTDDTKAFMKAWKAVCNNLDTPTFFVPGCRRFLINPIVFHGPCMSKRIKFKVEGTLTAPKMPSQWKCIDKKCESWISFKYVDGLTISGSGTINGEGNEWWKQGRVTGYRPNALVVTRCDNVQLRDVNFKDNPHMHVVFYKCKGVKISNIDIAASGNSPNTDGIHLKEVANAKIEYCSIGTGDDCISMVDGSTNIEINHVNCGPGHGISIGSLGKDRSREEVENIHVKNVRFNETTNGVRIKTWQGGRGHVKNIIFEKITSSNAQFPIIIDQFYCDHMLCPTREEAVEISNISFIDVTGTFKGDTAVKIECSRTVPCKGIFMRNINLIGHGNKVSSECINVIDSRSDGVINPSVTCSDNKI